MFKIKQNSIFFTIYNFFFIPLGYITLTFLGGYDYQFWLSLLVFFITINLVTNCAFVIIEGIGLLNPVFFFVILIYIFHFGQAILTHFLPNYHSTSTNFVKSGTNQVINCLIYSYVIVQTISFFLLIFFVNIRFPIRIKGIYKVINEHQFRFAAKVMFIFTAPFRYIEDYTRVTIMRVTNDYLETFKTNFSGIFSQIASFYLIAIIMIMLAYRNSKNLTRIFSVFITMEYVISMLSGGRAYAVISLYIYFFIYFSCVEKIDGKKAIMIAVLGYILLKFVTIISNVRLYGISLESIRKFSASSQNNFLVNILDEFGSTIFTVRETMEEIPDVIPYHYGLSFVKSLAMIGVNIGGSLDQIRKEVCYTLILTKRYSYGGSIVGELYYNFGFWGVMFAPVEGALIAKIIKTFMYYLEQKDFARIPFIIMPLYGVIVWIRDYCTTLVRGPVWAWLLLMVIYYFAVRIKLKGK